MLFHLLSSVEHKRNSENCTNNFFFDDDDEITMNEDFQKHYKSHSTAFVRIN